MQRLVAELMEQAEELMTHAPGTVTVRRISQIDDVQLLRSARAALTETERFEVDQVRVQLMERLDGAQTAKVAKRKLGSGFVDRLMSKLTTPMHNLATVIPTTADPLRASSRLPAPIELIDAAEAWLLSHLVADRLQVDLAPLRPSWDEATIEPIS